MNTSIVTVAVTTATTVTLVELAIVDCVYRHLLNRVQLIILHTIWGGYKKIFALRRIHFSKLFPLLCRNGINFRKHWDQN